MFKKTTLSNGLRVITVPQESSKTVTVLILVGTGSKYERKEISGVSHFLEHMLAKGTVNRPTEMDVFAAMDEAGGVFNAFTGPDYTGYYAKVESSKFDIALDWTSDIFLNATLPQEEIAKERGTIIEELNMFYDNPARHISTVWTQALYGDQPAGWDIGGTKETVSNIKREDLLSYRQSQYVASNTIVCASGNFNEAQALKNIGNYFAGISTAKPSAKAPVIEFQQKPQVLIYPKETNQTQLAMGVRAYKSSNDKRYAAEVLDIILGGMMTSRLMEEVRIKRGLAYYANTEMLADPDAGYLMANANLDTSRLKEGIGVILGEFKKIASAKVSPEELKRAKDNYIGKGYIALESSHALASFYAEQELLEERALTPGEIFAKIKAVTADDVLNVARDIFKPEKLNLALIGPFGDKAEFEEILKL
ncbi:MAG: pitrilysin family protein [Candidatus Paceibacterota bacterium]